MINFQSKTTKSIIIAIFILSLTISIYIVPASAIVTGTLSPSDIYPLFELDKFNYITVRGGSIYSPATEFRPFVLYPYTTAQDGLVDEDGLLYYNRALSGLDSSLSSSEYFRLWLPLGIQNSDKITIQFMIVMRVYNLYIGGNFVSSPDLIFQNVVRNSVANNLISFKLQTNAGTINLKPSVFEYDGIMQFSATPPSSSDESPPIYSFGAKVFDIEINNVSYADTLYVDFHPDFAVMKDYIADTSLSFGVTKIFYEGANVQLTGIQNSINDLISGIENQGSILQDMTEQQAEFYQEVLQLSPEGQQIIQNFQNNFAEGEQGLDDLIQGITVDKPDPDELLPDHDVVLGRYMDSGGSEVLGAVITPLFDETGPIYIMLFAVLSIALISYVLYGKKA